MGVGIAYIVQRVDWEYNDNWNQIVGQEPVKAFLDRELAELYRGELESAARHRGNPFVYTGRFAATTSLSASALAGELGALRLPLPPLDERNELNWWDEAWWDGIVALLSDRNAPAYYERLRNSPPSDAESERLLQVTLDDLWRLLDRYRTYEVVPIELEQP